VGGQVGVGSRWEGELNVDAKSEQILNPQCAAGKNCSCAMPNGDPNDYTDEYRRFLLMFAEGTWRSPLYGWCKDYD